MLIHHYYQHPHSLTNINIVQTAQRSTGRGHRWRGGRYYHVNTMEERATYDQQDASQIDLHRPT